MSRVSFLLCPSNLPCNSLHCSVSLMHLTSHFLIFPVVFHSFSICFLHLVIFPPSLISFCSVPVTLSSLTFTCSTSISFSHISLFIISLSHLSPSSSLSAASFKTVCLFIISFFLPFLICVSLFFTSLSLSLSPVFLDQLPHFFLTPYHLPILLSHLSLSHPALFLSPLSCLIPLYTIKIFSLSHISLSLSHFHCLSLGPPPCVFLSSIFLTYFCLFITCLPPSQLCHRYCFMLRYVLCMCIAH